MKILISHVYSNGNKGDAALLSVLVSDIRRGFDGAQMTILSLDEITSNEKFEGVSVKNSFMYYARDTYENKFIKVLYAFYVGTATLLWAAFYRLTKLSLPLPRDLKNLVDLYLDADLIIPVGGGYIRSQRGFMNTIGLFFIVHPFFFSYLLGKKTIGYSQSVGPFGNKFQAWMSKESIKTLDGILVRENISLDLLKKWGITKNVFLSVDSGFSFKSNTAVDIRQEFKISKEKMLVGITVRTWLAAKQQAQYEKTIAQLCDDIVKKYKAVIVFIPQVTVELQADDDRESSKRVFQYMKCKEQSRLILEKYDHHKIKAIYGGLDYLIGTRFHSVIFGITSYVPSIAIGYEHKTLGIMTDLGLEKWVLDIKNIEIENAKSLFDELVKNREHYLSHLKSKLPPYIIKSENSILIVKDIYERIKK
jgi:colanic acid/amylovoran biosynthesis protein